MSSKPVVVDGVSGYTGRLVCEHLRDFNIPFIAAGRDRGQKFADAGLLLSPGIAQRYTTSDIALDAAPGLDSGPLQAFAAYSLLQQAPRRVRFASACQAFGHEALLGTLRNFGLVLGPIVEVHS